MGLIGLNHKLGIIFIALLIVGFALFRQMNEQFSPTNDEQQKGIPDASSNRTCQYLPTPSPSIDGTWFQRRKEMLSGNPVRKILFFTHMRGGSTIGSRLFDEDPDAVLWKEPLAPFYSAYFGLDPHTIPQYINFNTTGDMSRINFLPEEQQLLANYFKAIFECQYDRLPPHVWMHPFMKIVSSAPISKGLRKCTKQYDDRDFSDYCGNIIRLPWNHMEAAKLYHSRQILEKMRDLIKKSAAQTSDHKLGEDLEKSIMSNYSSDHDEIVKKTVEIVPDVVKMERCAYRVQRESISCLKEASEMCKKSNLQAADVNRLQMSGVESILQTNPDLFIIHYIRDPRGTALSRNMTTGWALHKAGNESIYHEADFLCQRMREDLRVRHRLQAKYPGVFLQLRYEDFILDPIGVAARIYQFVGKEFPSTSRWREFVGRAFHAEKDVGYVIRANATKSIDKWKTAIAATDLERIRHVCSDLLMEFGYPL